jgi:hypothetical protein
MQLLAMEKVQKILLAAIKRKANKKPGADAAAGLRGVNA